MAAKSDNSSTIISPHKSLTFVSKYTTKISCIPVFNSVTDEDHGGRSLEDVSDICRDGSRVYDGIVKWWVKALLVFHHDM